MAIKIESEQASERRLLLICHSLFQAINRGRLTGVTLTMKYNKLCAWRHNVPPPLQVDNIFVFIHQVAMLFQHVGYLRHQQQADL